MCMFLLCDCKHVSIQIFVVFVLFKVCCCLDVITATCRYLNNLNLKISLTRPYVKRLWIKRKKGRAKFYARQTMERRTGFQCPSPPSSLWTAAHAEAFPVHGVSSHWREGPWDIDMSEVTRSRVRPQIPGRGHQIQSEATRSRARPPDPERGHQIQSEATRSRARPPDPEWG